MKKTEVWVSFNFLGKQNVKYVGKFGERNKLNMENIIQDISNDKLLGLFNDHYEASDEDELAIACFYQYLRNN
jgi:hypothetical protein